MCNRVSLQAPPDDLIQALNLSNVPALWPRFNLAPTQRLLIVRQVLGGRPEAVLARWGLLPAWANRSDSIAALFNARSETAHRKPAFRAAFHQRRCLIPVDGFYEWQKAGRKKLPFWITLRSYKAFALAGLWERCDTPDGPLDSCTILTTTANEVVGPLHDRMPVVLPVPDCLRWLDPELSDPAALQPLLRPYPADQMLATAVSSFVNSVKNEGPQCIAPAESERTLFD